MTGDYSVIVYWRTSEGEERKVQTSASGYAKTESQIESWGGSIYKITRVGGGKVTPPTPTEPAKVEDKVIAEVSPSEPQPEPTEESPFNIFEQALIQRGQYDIAKSFYEKRTGIKLNGKPKGTREYLGKGRDITGFGFDRTFEFETKPKLEKTFFDVEWKAGKQAKLNYLAGPSLITEKQKAGYETYLYQQRVLKIEREAIRRRMAGKEGLPGHLYEFGRLWYTGLTPENLLWHKQIGEAILGKEKGKEERLLRDYSESIVAAQKRWKITGPTGIVAEPFMPGGLGFMFGTTFALSIGIGAVSAAYPTIGKVTQVGLAGYGSYSIATSKDPYKSLLRAGVALPFILFGYRKGFRFGYGRTEQYLYKIHTYKPGTPEYIRFEQAMKVGRLLERVSPVKKTALDFAKDIMRMDKKTAQAFMEYYAAHKGVVGGSAASYTQIIGARQPRDIDYFMQRILLGTEKKVALAKQILPTKKFIGIVKDKPKFVHRIDIHGKEMYYPGKYHRFGFVSQRSIKIEGYKYFTAGEQLFRKGVASVVKEAQYRWFKDIPDFITHAKSQIISLRGKVSPLAQYKATKAEVALELFLHPEKAVGYGKADLGFIGRFFKATTKPVEPKIVYQPWGYEYIYPSSAYPSYLTGVGISGYLPTVSIDYKLPVTVDYKPYLPTEYKSPLPYKPTYEPPYKPPIYEPPYAPPYQPPYEPPYKPPPYQPPYEPPYKPPPYQPPYEPPYKPPPYEPPYAPPIYPPSIPPPPPKTIIPDESHYPFGARKEQGYHVYVKERYIEHGKKVKPERLLKIKIHALTQMEAHALGKHLVDRSAAQTYTIKPTTEKPKLLKLDVDSLIITEPKFYKKGNLFIEKRKHAIDTAEERQEITAQGLLNRMKRQQKITIPKEKIKIIYEKSSKIADPFAFDIDIDKEMKKMMRGFGF